MRSSNNRISRCGTGIAIAVACLLAAASCREPVPGHPHVKRNDSAALEILAQSPAHTVLSRQTVVRFGQTTLKDSATLYGIIIPDERRTNKIAARFGGRVEKLYVRLPYQYVRKGEKLLDLYSPDLTTAIGEYLFLRERDSASSMVLQSRQKLKLFNLTDAQIAAFEKSGEAPSTISLYSPYEGYLISFGDPAEQAAGPEETSAGGMNGMSQPGSDEAAMSGGGAVREGSYVVAGQTLFAINNVEKIIAWLSISPGTQGAIQTGMPVAVESELLPGRVLNGTVLLVEPGLESGQRFPAVRVLLENPGGLLKINSLVKATLPLAGESLNLLPASAVLDLGKRQIVWVKSGELDHVPYFTPRVVVARQGSARLTEILSGLKPGEEVALDAGLLTDREGIIQTELP
jgi:membrane fusion protein, copper/silver efflux system